MTLPEHFSRWSISLTSSGGSFWPIYLDKFDRV